MLVNSQKVKLTSYKPKPQIALKYFQTKSGKYRAVDRGKSYDKYKTEIDIQGAKGNIDTIINEIKSNRDTGSHVLTLSDFSDNETIFLNHIDYSGTINATVLDYTIFKQKSKGAWQIRITLQAINPVISGSGSFPVLSNLEFGYKSGNTFSVSKPFTYDNGFTYQDTDSDEAIFEGIFNMGETDTVELLKYIVSNRGSNYSITSAKLPGVSEPFGKNYSGGYPYTAKLIEWEWVERIGLDRNRIKLKFAKV